MTNKKDARAFNAAAKMLKSVAHPVRIEIINHLMEKKSLTVNDLKERLKITRSMTSQHLAVLKSAGIVACDKQANACHYFIRNRNVLKLLDCVEHCAKQ